ncbi:MAG: phage Gp37/Gp68 family protein [bacterium]|nr:phage Gp37/Gp68 family protein [bacterium]
MASYSKIEWTRASWNPVTGCTPVSAGCDHCYARRMALRLKAAGMEKYAHGFEVTPHERELQTPVKWKKPRVIFTCSMGDLFHEEVPDQFIERVFDVMKKTDRHVYQVLTKRPERVLDLAPRLPWPENIWIGTTVEKADCLGRIEKLRQVPAALRFLSLEPLLGPLTDLDLNGIGWVIVGGESGPGAREMKKEWAIEVRDICRDADVPFFFKQWGGVQKKKRGRHLDGRLYSEMPEILTKGSPQPAFVP